MSCALCCLPTGPNRSTLRAMLANLGDEEDRSAVQPGGTSGGERSAGNSMPHVDEMGTRSPCAGGDDGACVLRVQNS